MLKISKPCEFIKKSYLYYDDLYFSIFWSHVSLRMYEEKLQKNLGITFCFAADMDLNSVQNLMIIRNAFN